MSNIFNYFSRFDQSYFFANPPFTKIIYAFFVFYLVLLVSVIFISVLMKRKNETYKEFSKSFFWTNLIIIILGLLITFMRYENVNLLSWRIWQILNVLILVFLNGYYFFYKKPELNQKQLKLEAKKRKDKWLPKSKKKK